jgi:hypothetical protein
LIFNYILLDIIEVESPVYVDPINLEEVDLDIFSSGSDEEGNNYLFFILFIIILFHYLIDISSNIEDTNVKAVSSEVDLEPAIKIRRLNSGINIYIHSYSYYDIIRYKEHSVHK